MMRFESQGRLIAAEETLTACLEPERVTHESLRFQNAEQFGTFPPCSLFARFSLGRAGNRLQVAV
jgi:hypothetical protein